MSRYTEIARNIENPVAAIHEIYSPFLHGVNGLRGIADEQLGDEDRNFRVEEARHELYLYLDVFQALLGSLPTVEANGKLIHLWAKINTIVNTPGVSPQTVAHTIDRACQDYAGLIDLLEPQHL